jgi:hypothetical protein
VPVKLMDGRPRVGKKEKGPYWQPAVQEWRALRERFGDVLVESEVARQQAKLVLQARVEAEAWGRHVAHMRQLREKGLGGAGNTMAALKTASKHQRMSVLSYGTELDRLEKLVAELKGGRNGHGDELDRYLQKRAQQQPAEQDDTC